MGFAQNFACWTALSSVPVADSVRMQAALGPRTSVFLSDVETDVWPEGTVQDLSLKSARWLVTRGELGADEVVQGTSTQLPPEKVHPDSQQAPS